MSYDQPDSRSSRYGASSRSRIGHCLGESSPGARGISERRAIALRGALTIAISAALTVASTESLQAGSDPSEVELGMLDGTNGFSINGEAGNDRLGQSVSGIGDINGDGIDDALVGAFLADPNGDNSGRAYVVFGASGGFTSPLDPSTLDGTNGFVINGEAAEDRAGWSVGGAGDVNDDGIDDLIIGAIFSSPNGDRSGRAYVVFGASGGFTSPLELSSLDGANGFMLNGEAEGDEAGESVAGAGDINGDGIDDLIIGSSLADGSGDRSGRAYVVFGSGDPFPGIIELSSLDGVSGFKIDGEAATDYAGVAVAGAGDINADGLDDLLVGAHFADPNGITSGRSYVIFGSSDPFTSPFSLSALNGLNGFAINGEAAQHRSGESLAGAGDLNGDTIDDLIIGAARAEVAGTRVGRSYVVFGSDQAFVSELDLADLNGTNGFIIDGEAEFDDFGASVASAGDVNSDGIDDLLIGADGADPNGNASGRGYVLFGTLEPRPSPFSVASLDSSNGFVLNGEALGDNTGESVSGLGDFNGDGIADLALGARGADPNGSSSGRAHIVFGRRGDALFADRFEAP
jgi:hypothetical protein